MMAQRAQEDTPRNRSKYRQLTSYRDFVPAPRSHTAPTDATSKPAQSVGVLGMLNLETEPGGLTEGEGRFGENRHRGP